MVELCRDGTNIFDVYKAAGELSPNLATGWKYSFWTKPESVEKLVSIRDYIPNDYRSG